MHPGTTVSVGAGVQYSKGLEFDGNWQALPNLNILAGVSGGNFYYGYQGTNTALVGLQTVNVPRFQGTMSVAYQATKSLLLTFDCRAFSSFRVSNTTVNGPVANTTASDGHLQVRGPGYGIFDFGAVYSWSVAKTTQSLGVTVKNAFNHKNYVLVNSMVAGNALGVYATFRVRR